MGKRTLIFALVLMALVRSSTRLIRKEELSIRPFVGIAVLGILLSVVAELNEDLAGRFAVLALLVTLIATVHEWTEKGIDIGKTIAGPNVKGAITITERLGM